MNTTVSTLVLFGAFGDLARRKLYLSLFSLYCKKLPAAPLHILALGRREVTSEDFRAQVEQIIRARSDDTEHLQAWLQQVDYLCLDLNDQHAYQGIAEWRGQQPEGAAIFYLATAAPLYGPSCDGLAAAQVIAPHDRVVVEKPIGYDLPSSRRINDCLAHHFREPQIYRIDHYLGKETVQNLLALRFANSLFETQWNQQRVSHVEITIAETVGIEGRWDYFDQAGQMRDMVQSHLLQLLCLIAMDPPNDLGADAIRDEKLKVLRALKHFDGQALDRTLIRGQYTGGNLAGATVPGYLQEEGANPASETGTFFAARLEIDNWRWAGVPFYVRTGKRLPTKLTQIVLHFKPAVHFLFDQDQRHIAENKLVIRIQPDEGISLQVLNKESGLDQGMRLRRLPLDLSFHRSGEQFPDAYERLIWEVIRGDQYLFVRRDEVEAAWRWCDHLMQVWDQQQGKPLAYAAGTWGPAAAIALMTRDGWAWHEDND